MIRSLAVAACTAAVLSAVLAPVAEGHRVVAPDTCGLRYMSTRLLTESVRIVATREDLADEGAEQWYACLRVNHDEPNKHVRKHGFRKRRFLDTVDCTSGFGCVINVAVSQSPSYYAGYYGNYGPKVAFANGSCGPDSCFGTVMVLAIRTGRRAYAEIFDDGLPDLDVTQAGTAVWVEDSSTTRYLRTLTLEEQVTQLDEGPDLSDLALGGNTLFWKNGPEVKSASVP